MKIWSFILVEFLLVTLGIALEDANVFVNGTFSQGKFELRVWPNWTRIACANTYQSPIGWFRISHWQQVLLDFAGGMNNKNATFSLGTPTFGLAFQIGNVSGGIAFCQYLPNAYQNATAANQLVGISAMKSKTEYFAVKVNGTAHATMRRGFNYVKNLVQNRFQDKSGMNPTCMAFEIAASGQVYVGVMKDFTYN